MAHVLQVSDVIEHSDIGFSFEVAYGAHVKLFARTHAPQGERNGASIFPATAGYCMLRLCVLSIPSYHVALSLSISLSRRLFLSLVVSTVNCLLLIVAYVILCAHSFVKP